MQTRHARHSSRLLKICASSKKCSRVEQLVRSGRLRVPETSEAAPRKQMTMNLEAAERRYNRTVATYFQQSQA